MNDLSLDINNLADMPVKSMLVLLEAQREMHKTHAKFLAVLRAKSALFGWLEAQDIEPRFDYRSRTVDISFAGDGDRLGLVWAELRRHGFEPSSRPKKGDTSYCAFWESTEGFIHLWVSFTSTSCTRVQVGTKTVEVPVYETRCGGLSIDQDSKELV